MAEVEELDEETGLRWRYHLGTNVDGATRAELLRRAAEEATTMAAFMRRALVRELERVRGERERVA